MDLKVRETTDNRTVVMANGLCGVRTVTLSIPIIDFMKGWKEHKAGALIQDAFPTLNADEREFLLTGLTKEDWEELHGEEPS